MPCASIAFLSLGSSATFKAGGDLFAFGASGEVIMEGATTWNGSAGASDLVNRGTLTIGSVQMRADTFRNEGIVIQTGFFSPQSGQLVDIINPEGSIWEVRGNPSITITSFLNEGTLRRSQGDGAFTLATAFTSTGDIDIQTGSLVFSRGGSTISAGTMSFSEGTTLRYQDNATHVIDQAASITSTPRLELAGSAISPTTTVTIRGVTDWAAPLSFFGGVMVFTDPITFHDTLDDRANFFSLPGGAVFKGETSLRQCSSPNDLIFEGNSRFSIFFGTGQRINRGTMATSNLLEPQLRGGTLRNEGVFTQLHSLAAREGGKFHNAPGAVWDIQGDLAFNRFDTAEQTADFTNEGELRKSAGLGEALFHPGIQKATFRNAGGSVRAQSGTLRFQGTATQTSGSLQLEGGAFRSDSTFPLEGGVITGDGTWTGSINNTGGIMRPGFGAGVITITGNYTQGADGTLEMEIGGAPASGNVDKLDIGATATLGGTFALSILDGYVSPEGESFDLVTYAGHVGEFAVLGGLSPGNGVSYTESYDADSFTLAAGAAIPEASPVFANSYRNWVERIAVNRDRSPGGPTEDPDGDGRPNLLEYAFSGDPLLPDLDGFPKVRIGIDGDGGRYLFVTYCERGDAPDLSYRLQSSGDLTRWVTRTDVEEVSRVVLHDSMNRSLVTLRVPAGRDVGRTSLRLAVERE